jgi:catechol 2,3-dioxygenase-like lactoylglutathione lyase family enzyme
MIAGIWSITFTVVDLDRAVRFYEQTLGLSKKYQFRDYAGFSCGGIEIGLKTWGELEAPRQGEASIELLVKDVDAEYHDLIEKGVRFSDKPEDTPWGGRAASFTDPDGNIFQLTQIDWRRYFQAAAR